MLEKLNLTQEWDKVFPKSDKVDHRKVPSITATALRWQRICTRRKAQRASCPPSPSAAPSVRWRSSPPACMRRKWRSWAF